MSARFYRFMYLDSDGRVFQREDFPLADDVAAVEQAAKLATQHAIEIWAAGRRVALVKKGDRPLRADEGGAL